MCTDGHTRLFCGLLAACFLAVWTCLTPQSANAQDQRAFATPLYWLNSTSDLRLPIRERDVFWFTGITGPRPPSPKQSGWTPRLSFGVENRDQTQGIAGTDTIATLTPGLSYVKHARRWSFGADVTFDLAKHFDEERFSYDDPNLIADAQFLYSLSPDSAITVFAGYSRLRDTGDAVLDGFLPVNTVISRRNTSLTWANRLSERKNFEVLYANSLEATDQPLQSDIKKDTVSALFGYTLSQRDLIEGVAYFDHVQFENVGDDNVGSAFARYTRDMGDRLALSGELGVIGTTASGGRHYPKLGAALTHTANNAKYELRAGRDIYTLPGLNSLVLTDQVSASGLFRFTRGLQLQALAERQLFSGLGAVPVDIQVSSVELGLSYAATRNLWLWARLRESRQKSGGTRSNDTRVYLGVSRTFN